MRVEWLELRADFYIAIWPDVVRAPDFPTRSRVERSDPSANAHFSTTRSDDHTILHDDRRHGDRLTTSQISHLCAPHLPSTRCIDSDGVTVEQIVEDFPIRIRSTAI